MSDAWTHEFSFPVPAAPEKVFTAWTDPGELERWFAEHARVEPGPDGALHFWGRHTVGTPEEGEGGGRIVTWERNSVLGFEWPILGVASTVTVTFSPEDTERGPGTKVIVRQAFDGLPDVPRPRELVDDWWRFTLGNLTAHLAGPGEVLRVDFADPSPEIRISMHVAAAPRTVFRALTRPELLNQWMAKDARVDLRVGGAWDPGFAPEDYTGPGMEILELEEDRKLVISWPDWRGDTAVPMQSVTWLLVPEADGTRVTLIHSGFVRTVDLSDYPFGWGHFLSELRRVVEAA